MLPVGCSCCVLTCIYFLQRKMDANIRNSEGQVKDAIKFPLNFQTVLHCCVIHGKLLMAEELINCFTPNLNALNYKGETALHIAARMVRGSKEPENPLKFQGNEQMVNLLLNAGARY